MGPSRSLPSTDGRLVTTKLPISTERLPLYSTPITEPSTACTLGATCPLDLVSPGPTLDQPRGFLSVTKLGARSGAPSAMSSFLSSDPSSSGAMSTDPPTLKRPKRIVKIAVVGSGLAGLTASYLLANLSTRRDVEFPLGDEVDFEVHVFEKVSLKALKLRNSIGAFSRNAAFCRSGPPDTSSHIRQRTPGTRR